MVLVFGSCLVFKSHMVSAEDQVHLLKSQIELQIQKISTTPPLDPVRIIIRNQLDAIQNRNADSAFAMMTQSLHDKFDSAKNFLSIMHFEYRPIYNYKSYIFLDGYSMSDKITIQKIEIKTRNDDLVTVIYSMKKQPDAGWLIDSFTVLDNKAQAI